MPNGIPLFYQLDRSISVLRVVALLGGIFYFHSNSNRTFCKQTVETLIRRRILCQIWVSTVCLCPTKRTLGLYGLISLCGWLQNLEIFWPCKVSARYIVTYAAPNESITVKPVLSGHSKRMLKIVFKTYYRLMQVKSIAECSKGSILQYFRPSLSYHLSLRSLFCLFLSGPLRQVLLYLYSLTFKKLNYKV